jgi:hypothetical protein
MDEIGHNVEIFTCSNVNKIRILQYISKYPSNNTRLSRI